MCDARDSQNMQQHKKRVNIEINIGNKDHLDWDTSFCCRPEMVARGRLKIFRVYSMTLYSFALIQNFIDRW